MICTWLEDLTLANLLIKRGRVALTIGGIWSPYKDKSLLLNSSSERVANDEAIDKNVIDHFFVVCMTQVSFFLTTF